MENHFRVDDFSPALSFTNLIMATGGELLTSNLPSNKQIHGITTDSRLVQPEDLFIPLRGSRSDGHQHIGAALQAGAIAVLGEKAALKPHLQQSGVLIAVEDTLKALGDIAKAWRKQWSLPLLALTGSNGKTTTKELTVHILEQAGRTHATWRNWNNWIGVPLTLLGLREQHQFAVVEMGMNDFGEIRRLVEIASPNFRLITNIMPVHLEKLGNLQNVARAKAEILEGMNAAQTFIMNGDDPLVCEVSAQLSCKRLTYSLKSPHEVTYGNQRWPVDVTCEAVNPLGAAGYSGKLRIQQQSYAFTFPLVGEHNLLNMLAAVTSHTLWV